MFEAALQFFVNGLVTGCFYALIALGLTLIFGMMGTLPGRYSASGYNTIHMIAQAIQRAGAPDSQKIRDALTKTDYEGPNGRIRFDAKHQAYGLNMVLVELQNKAQVVKAISSIEKP
jgi:ABC-type branched-subunit amino acid transport system substrate-binding protein